MFRLSPRFALLALGTVLIALFSTAGNRPRAVVTEAASFDPMEKSITELQTALNSGQLTSADLVQFYLDRIAAYDQAGPRLNAMIYVNPKALETARALDAERARSGPRGPLHGIPVIIKDNMDTFDMPTTGGSIGLVGTIPPDDAFQVRKLREAGAIIMGKSNLQELALGYQSVSSLGGQVLNPYDPRRIASGSSGGSAAGVAANFAVFSMGSDTLGSIRDPSSFNSLVGLRPTVGLSSRDGVQPLSALQDTMGPLARNVSDVAIILDATAGFDPTDPVTIASQGKVPPTYTAFLKSDGLKGARIGILNALFGAGPEEQEVSAIVRSAVEDMTAQGATTIDVAIPNLSSMLTTGAGRLVYDFNEYLRNTPNAPMRSIKELLDSGMFHSNSPLAFQYASAVLEEGRRGASLETDAYRQARANMERLRQLILQAMEDNKVDAIVYPTSRARPPLVTVGKGIDNAPFAALSALPAISVPAGFTSDGLPIGVELAGRPFDEPVLLRLAYAYEQATLHRRPPASTPFVSSRPATPPAAPVSGDVGGVSFEAIASGKNASPPSDVAFSAIAHFSFNDATRELGYVVQLTGSSPDLVAGSYLHHRDQGRPNGGVIQILSKVGASLISGKVTLSNQDMNDLKAGNLYFDVVSKASPKQSARGNLVLPSPAATE